MLNRVKNLIRATESYLWGVKLQTFESPLNGKLELWLVNNRLVLNSAHANQSYDSLHRIFRKVFHVIHIREQQPRDVLLLGLGCGSVPAILLDELNLDCRITAVEHDETMLRIAREHFNLQRFKQLDVVLADASAYVAACEKQFDLVVVDLFHDDEVPQPFLGTDFNGRLKALVKKGRMLVFNMITLSDAQQQQFKELLSRFDEAFFIHAEHTNKVMVYRKGS